jgi:hypothetical protein
MMQPIYKVSYTLLLLLSPIPKFLSLVTIAKFGRWKQWKKSNLRLERRLVLQTLWSSGGSGIGFDGLTSALSKIESRQLIEKSRLKSSKERKENRWEKITLDSFTDDAREDNETPFSLSGLNNQEQVVYILRPPDNAEPQSIILFLGGAVLGSYPHIAYSELLHRISSKTNSSVIAVPYPIGLNHFDISKLCEKQFQQAVTHMEENMYTAQPPSSKSIVCSLPIYVLGHSLGCKLHLIRMSAVKNSWENLKGIGFVSFNNYGLSQSVSMAKSFASSLNGEAQKKPSNDETQIMDIFFNFVEQAAQGIGFDFSPNPVETERMIRLKFTNELQEKCRVFQFDQDELDCTQQFIRCCPNASVSTLPGTHLTPVYLQFGVNDLPENTQTLAQQMTDYQSASFGNEEQLDLLVDEVCSWMKGEPPQCKQQAKKHVTTLRLPSNLIDV